MRVFRIRKYLVHGPSHPGHMLQQPNNVARQQLHFGTQNGSQVLV
jgi:hypothetical protein